MSVKKITIAGMLTAIWIPFILLTDLYPFFRFGMFAEPVREAIQMEQFAVGYISFRQSRQVLGAEQLGISSLAYLMRNYYYRNQSTEFLENIHAIFPEKHLVKQWQFLRITSPVQVYRPDTVIVARFNPLALP
jgi:hypothetical protein